ncbi:MAG: DUF2157 domain-containing protein [Candidatus Omnitrophica bacterium]|nr:DUF2157 domain-containing protein [Candidatus Omnitrophota bacterium]
MNSRNLKWLYRELPVLVNKEIISQQNADRIKQYYGQVSEAGKKKAFLVVCSVLGALLIGLGIISLIAHNWELLSRPVRAVLSLVPLVIGIVLTGRAIIKEPPSQGFWEAAATFLTLMVGASISLICQTYNIPGDPRSFVLTWMLLSVPLVYLAGVTIPALIYIIGITSWAGAYIGDNAALSLCYWPLMAVVAPHFISILKQKGFVVRANLFSSILALSLALYTASFMIWFMPHLWMVYLSLLFASMYLIGTRRFPAISHDWQIPFRRIGELGVIVVSLILTYRGAWSMIPYWDSRDMKPFEFQGGILLVIIYSIVTLLLVIEAIKEKRFGNVLIGIAPVAAVAGFSFSSAAMVLYNIYFLIFSLERVRSGFRENKVRAVNTGLLLLILVVMLRFFDSGINLVLKGLVLILLGAGFLVVNMVVIRRKGGVNE